MREGEGRNTAAWETPSGFRSGPLASVSAAGADNPIATLDRMYMTAVNVIHPADLLYLQLYTDQPYITASGLPLLNDGL